MMGIIAGSVLPSRAVSALSVALYGMFLAIIIPPSKKDKAVGVAVIVSFLLSYLCRTLKIFTQFNLSSGTVTIILTLIISSAAAIIRPVLTNTDEMDS